MSSAPPHRQPWLLRHLSSSELTARRAASFISLVTLLLTIGSAVLVWVVDRHDFDNLGISLWWALQTVTTVGYGDVVPTSTGGRLIGGLVMLIGIAFVAVVTAAIAAALIESGRRRLGRDEEAKVADLVETLGARLDRLEQAVRDSARRDQAPPER
jgi:voltage-gated potassium channel